ncbi:MAG: DUF3429 domain-containing protein [Casimicrobiaceae bacterium]
MAANGKASGPAPGAAVALGVGGLVPFVALALLAVLVPQWYAIWLDALATYGAVILAFVGALHWGYALRAGTSGPRAWLQYGWSVVPALVGWLSLQTPVWTCLRLQAAMLVACLAVDRAMRRIEPFPTWFMRLRALLTVVAVAALAGASIA